MNAAALGLALLAPVALAAAAAPSQTRGVQQHQAHVERLVPARVPFDPRLIQALVMPPGFRVSLFATGLVEPRMLEVLPDGTVLVTRPGEGDVVALRDRDLDGVADESRVYAAGLPGVHGIARRGDELYLASSTTVWRTALAAAAPQTIVTGLPDGGQHRNRTLGVGPDGYLYLSIGSSCNDCAEENLLERGTMVKVSPDGSQRSVMANGLRNTIGFDWHPLTGAMWGMDHGSDFRGDTIPPEELNRLRPGTNYGWPVCYGQRVVDAMTHARPAELALEPGRGKPSGQAISRAAYCAQTEPARLVTEAHSAPMAMRFYTGSQFPAAYRNDAFVAMHGSWNRGDPVGYKVLRIRFGADGEPLGFEDFLTGFLTPHGPSMFGRPVGLAIAADGALLVSDDGNGVIYRVSYPGAAPSR